MTEAAERQAEKTAVLTQADAVQLEAALKESFRPPAVPVRARVEREVAA